MTLSERLLKLLAAMCLVSGTAALLLADRYYTDGSLFPDPRSGRTYPVRQHGVVYVAPELGRTVNSLTALAVWSLLATALLSWKRSGR